jgi:hypothetical protein
MNRFLLALLFVSLMVPVAHATTKVTNVTNVTNTYVDETARNEFGVAADAPNLVRLTDNWSLGTEVGHNFNGTSSNEGYFVYAKATYTGTLLDLRKK